MTNHFKECNAPICQDSFTEDTVWYPGEEICNKKPFDRIQKMQHSLNYLLNKNKLDKVEDSFTASDLKRGGI